MTTPDRSVEETTKEFWEGVMEVNVEDIKSDTIYLVSDDDIKSLLQAERQKREEEVEAVLHLVQGLTNDTELILGIEKALTLPNNNK